MNNGHCVVQSLIAKHIMYFPDELCGILLLKVMKQTFLKALLCCCLLQLNFYISLFLLKNIPLSVFASLTNGLLGRGGMALF